MGSIKISGMASGLPPNIVEQIMEAEKIPVKTMEAKKAKEEDTLKLVGELETKVSDINKNLGELVGTKGFSDTKFSSGDPSIVDGVVDPSQAVTGEYQLEVLQLAEKPGALSNGFPDKDNTQIGVGYIKFQTDAGDKEVYINGDNSTLQGVANQINGSATGIRASVIEDRKDKDYPFKLLVTGLATGSDKDVNFPTIYMLDGDQDIYFDQSKKSQNGKIKLDGFEFEVSSNNVENLIPGVTLDLKQAAPGRPIRANVKENLEVISGKIKTFVESYNAALSFIQGQNKIQKGQNGKEGLGPLGGQGILRSIENTLRRVIQSTQRGTGSNISRMIELGVEFNRNGTLTFSQEKFEKVLNANPKMVSSFFRGDGFNTGFVATVKREVGYLLNIQSGALPNRKKGLQSKIENANKSIERKEKQLERKEEQLRRQFSDLESKMSRLNSQGAAVGAMASGQQKG